MGWGTKRGFSVLRRILAELLGSVIPGGPSGDLLDLTSQGADANRIGKGIGGGASGLAVLCASGAVWNDQRPSIYGQSGFSTASS